MYLTDNESLRVHPFSKQISPPSDTVRAMVRVKVVVVNRSQLSLQRSFVVVCEPLICKVVIAIAVAVAAVASAVIECCCGDGVVGRGGVQRNRRSQTVHERGGGQGKLRSQRVQQGEACWTYLDVKIYANLEVEGPLPRGGCVSLAEAKHVSPLTQT